MGEPGLPHAGRKWFQMAPMDPPQMTAEPLSQAGGASEKAYIRKGTAVKREDQEEKVRETAPWTPRSETKEGEEMLQALEQISTLYPMIEQADMP